VKAPILEELTYRFAFDKIWNGLFLFGSYNAPTARPVWGVISSLSFGLAHMGNWLPFRGVNAVQFLDEPRHDDEGENEYKSRLLIQAVHVSLLHGFSASLSAIFLLLPMYQVGGLAASIVTHMVTNAIGVGLHSLHEFVSKTMAETKPNVLKNRLVDGKSSALRQNHHISVIKHYYCWRQMIFHGQLSWC